MKIVFMVEGFPILSQTFVLNQITGLIDRGHEVDIYAGFCEHAKKIHPDVEKYDLLSHTFYYPKAPNNKLLYCLKGLWLIIINFLKSPLVILRCLNLKKYGKEALTLRLLYAAIPLINRRQTTYDIIQCHFGLLGIKGMMLRDVGAIHGKLVTTFHGVDISQNLQLFGENLYHDLFQQGDYFLPISNHWQNRLVELGCEPHKIIVHRMGIDCRRFIFISRRLASGGSIQLISVARLTEKKGIEYGIRALAKILPQYPDIEYNIIGNGELCDSLTRLINDLEVGSQVHLLGWKQQAEVIELLNQSHILLAPSITEDNGNQEGIPVALMEAMAMGLPVVSTFHSGIPELVENEISGLLVAEKDIDALAEALTRLFRQPESWAQFGQAGRRRVEQEYNISTLNDRLAVLYQTFLQSGSTHHSDEDVKCGVSDRAMPAASIHPTPMT